MYCSYTRFCSSVRRDSFAAPVFRSARLQTVYCVKQVRHCFLFIASSFFVLLRSVLYPYRYINQRSKMKRKNSGCYFSSSMPDRKMRDAGRNRREECVNKVVAIFLKKFMQLFLCLDSRPLLHELYTVLSSCRTSAPDERTLLH